MSEEDQAPDEGAAEAVEGQAVPTAERKLKSVLQRLALDEFFASASQKLSCVYSRSEGGPRQGAAAPALIPLRRPVQDASIPAWMRGLRLLPQLASRRRR